MFSHIPDEYTLAFPREAWAPLEYNVRFAWGIKDIRNTMLDAGLQLIIHMDRRSR
jgi:hypothetical protein